ncbi:VOC family protein [Fusibacter paucivorans]|uniref:VOC family protein n=1 Tax=Fusibacter paucivorans TaxID=76009 RepID=A0ABS5PV02_9FIRM|nr:VOC family protein [Fusibacter paucivorans]MBS7528807.1 VOC family protein [Fusibacter paucivorans]
MKTNLQHIRLNVSDIERSLKWYTEVLGFEVGNCWPLDNPIYYDFLSDNGATFSIGQVKGVNPSGRVNFTVENVDELWETINDKVIVIEPIFDTPWGTRKFTILDIDGNELGFVV